MKYALLILLTLTNAVTAWSGDFTERAMETYYKTDSNYDLDCYYSMNKTYKLITPVNETQKSANSISREFMIEDLNSKVPMTFTVKRENKLISYEAVLNKIHVAKNKLGKRDFFLPPIANKEFETRFETTRIFCSVNFAYALPFDLTDGDYHFSVHPQKNYDWQSRLTAGIESNLNDPSMRSVIFLETGNGRGTLVNVNEFLDNKEPKIPVYQFATALTNVPDDVPLIVSPAGNNRFKIKASKEINIKFTGGNHNYCVWNVARHVLEDLMNSKSNARVNFNYDMSLLVAQVRGVEGMNIDFPKGLINKSNLLKDLLTTPQAQKSYHEFYLKYFIDYLAREYKAQYRTYNVQYTAPGFSKTITLNGGGERDLFIEFNYL